MKLFLQTFTAGFLYILFFTLIHADFANAKVQHEVSTKNESCILYVNNSIYCKRKTDAKPTIVTNLPSTERFTTIALADDGKVYGVTATGKLFLGTKNYKSQIVSVGNTKNQAKVNKKVKNYRPRIELNDDMSIQIEQGEKFVDFGATWDDKEDGKGIVLAKKKLKKNSKTNTYDVYNGGISTATAGTNYRLQYFYTDEGGKKSKTLTRYISVIEKIPELNDPKDKNSCSQYRLVCKENVFGEKTWQLNKEGFCIGKLMDKVGEFCVPPKEGKIQEELRSAYHGNDNLIAQDFTLEEKQTRNPFGERKAEKDIYELLDEEFEIEEGLTAAPEEPISLKERNEKFRSQMKLLLQEKYMSNIKGNLVSTANKKLVEKIINKVDLLEKEKQLHYLHKLFADLNDDMTADNIDASFLNYLQYFKKEIAKKSISI